MTRSRPASRCGLRRAAFAVLSWFGLTSAAAAPLHAQADTNTLATKDALTALLAKLDACFGRRDVDGYLGFFEPDHPGAHAMLRHHLQRLFHSAVPLVRTSKLVTEPRVVGTRTLVRVRHEVRLTNDAPGGKNDQKAFTPHATTYVEDTFLAVRIDRVHGEPTVVPTFSIEFPRQAECVRNDWFRCPPCNYEVGGVAGWLCVPVRGDRAHALEAASFYLIGTDVACDVSVQVDAAAPPATAVARQLGEALRALDATARPGLPVTWVPPAHRQDTPSCLAGARLEIDLPQDFASAGGLAVFHVATVGGLQHLLLVRGSRAALRTHAAAVDALLASYRLLESNCDMALAAVRPLEHHLGGKLDGNRYQNDVYGVALAGPEGWTAKQRTGGAAFRVVWTSPRGSRLWLIGYAVPPGMNRWCQVTADRWLQQLCDSAGLRVESTGRSEKWDNEQTCGPMRSVVCTPRDVGKSGPGQRRLRLQLRDDLLLVADILVVTAEDEAAVEAALASLRRK